MTSVSKGVLSHRDLPDGPVVQNASSSAGDVSAIPGPATKIPLAKGQLSPHASTKSPQPQRRPSAAEKNKMKGILVAQVIKSLPARQETQFQPLGQEDPLEKGRATHSSVLAWRIPWTEEPGRLYSPWRCKELDMT